MIDWFTWTMLCRHRFRVCIKIASFSSITFSLDPVLVSFPRCKLSSTTHTPDSGILISYNKKLLFFSVFASMFYLHQRSTLTSQSDPGSCASFYCTKDQMIYRHGPSKLFLPDIIVSDADAVIFYIFNAKEENDKINGRHLL